MRPCGASIAWASRAIAASSVRRHATCRFCQTRSRRFPPLKNTPGEYPIMGITPFPPAYIIARDEGLLTRHSQGELTMDINLPIIAGTISTIFFASGELPMLVKAFQTKNLRSYSLGNILFANMGNVVYSIYVFHLPPGPIWALHSFYMTSTVLMLFWYLRYERQPGQLVAALRARLRRRATVLTERLPEAA